MSTERRTAMEDPQLQDALKELLLASEGFRRAYEMYARTPDPEMSWERTLLDEAQSRLDHARDRVHEVEMGIRDSELHGPLHRR